MCGDPRHEGISPQTGSHSATVLPLRRNTAKTNKHDIPNPKYVKTFLEKRKIRCCENISLLHICFKHPFITLVFMCRVSNLDLSFRQCAHTHHKPVMYNSLSQSCISTGKHVKTIIIIY